MSLADQEKKALWRPYGQKALAYRRGAWNNRICSSRAFPNGIAALRRKSGRSSRLGFQRLTCCTRTSLTKQSVPKHNACSLNIQCISLTCLGAFNKLVSAARDLHRTDRSTDLRNARGLVDFGLSVPTVGISRTESVCFDRARRVQLPNPECVPSSLLRHNKHSFLRSLLLRLDHSRQLLYARIAVSVHLRTRKSPRHRFGSI